MKKKNREPENEEDRELKSANDKELFRAYINSFLSPDKDEHISLEDDSFFEKIYGKEGYQKMKASLAERLKNVK
ncbi:MAG: hypothetical protein HWE15_05705 [Algoriphagus sp.]|uniref:hypothetical protein n=1 Tax=Algoriphagus sp. TaxID=1872435 RepID=UPI00185A1C6B|nr:hypothetical protein [Algoriphagus sp.]NVJ85781.1 hypothetical protein [Algoriphagus sp.]